MHQVCSCTHVFNVLLNSAQSSWGPILCPTSMHTPAGARTHTLSLSSSVIIKKKITLIGALRGAREKNQWSINKKDKNASSVWRIGLKTIFLALHLTAGWSTGRQRGAAAVWKYTDVAGGDLVWVCVCVCVSVFYGLRYICMLRAHDGDLVSLFLPVFAQMSLCFCVCCFKDVHVVPTSPPLLTFKCRSLSFCLTSPSVQNRWYGETVTL